jgi:polyhydroxybutyrate depolymerase
MQLGKMLIAVATTLTAVLAVPAAAPAQTPDDCATIGEAGTAYAPGVNCRTVEVDGQPRHYLVYVPRRPPVTGSRRPVVFMFHGTGGNGAKFLRISGWREQADATGLVAVFPTGLRYRVLESGNKKTKWNSFDLADEVDLDERPRGYPEEAPWPADDVGFVDAMVADLQAGLPVDRHRVYASGFSNGASFAARLAVERSEELAAAAFSGGGLDGVHAPARPIPMYATIGTRDDRVLEQTSGLTELPLNPVTLLTTPPVGAFLTAHVATLGLDRDLFGASALTHSTTVRWPATDPTFTFGALDEVTHQYPNGRNNPFGFALAPEFWEFFERHPLP